MVLTLVLTLAIPVSAAAKKVNIAAGYTYQGATTANVAYTKGYSQFGSIGIHLDSKKRINAFKLTWRCKGERYVRNINTATSDRSFEPVAIKHRAFKFKTVVDWYDIDPGLDSRKGTATISVTGRFLKTTPKRGKQLANYMSIFSVANGSFKVVDGTCTDKQKFDLDSGNTHRESLRMF